MEEVNRPGRQGHENPVPGGGAHGSTRPESSMKPLRGAKFRKLLNRDDRFDGSIIYPGAEVEAGRPHLFLVFDAPSRSENIKVQNTLFSAVEEYAKQTSLLGLGAALEAHEFKPVMTDLLDHLNTVCRQAGHQVAVAAGLYRDGLLAYTVVGDAVVVRIRWTDAHHPILTVTAPGRDLPGIVTARSMEARRGAEIKHASDPDLDRDGIPRYLGIRSAVFDRVQVDSLERAEFVLFTSDGLVDNIGTDLRRLHSVFVDLPDGRETAVLEVRDKMVRELVGASPVDDVCFIIVQEQIGFISGVRKEQEELHGLLGEVDKRLSSLSGELQWLRDAHHRVEGQLSEPKLELKSLRQAINEKRKTQKELAGIVYNVEQNVEALRHSLGSCRKDIKNIENYLSQLAARSSVHARPEFSPRKNEVSSGSWLARIKDRFRAKRPAPRSPGAEAHGGERSSAASSRRYAHSPTDDPRGLRFVAIVVVLAVIALLVFAIMQLAPSQRAIPQPDARKQTSSPTSAEDQRVTDSTEATSDSAGGESYSDGQR